MKFVDNKKKTFFKMLTFARVSFFEMPAKKLP
jgi:hypothetical protein